MLYWVPSSPSCFVGLCWVTIHFNCSPLALWFMPRKSWPNPYHQLFINRLYRRYRSIPTNHSRLHMPTTTCFFFQVAMPEPKVIAAIPSSKAEWASTWKAIPIPGSYLDVFWASFGCVVAVFVFFCRGSRRCLYIMNYAHKHIYIYSKFYINTLIYTWIYIYSLISMWIANKYEIVGVMNFTQRKTAPHDLRKYNHQILIHSEYPKGTMYVIFTYIWSIFMVNVGKYTIHGSFGIFMNYHPDRQTSFTHSIINTSSLELVALVDR